MLGSCDSFDWNPRGKTRPLRQLIDRPLIFPREYHHNLRSLRSSRPRLIGTRDEQRNRKGISPGLQLPPTRDFVGGIVARREKILHAIRRAALFGYVGEHKQSSFVVLVLPRLQKAIGRSQRGLISRLGNWEHWSALGLGNGDRGSLQRQRQDYEWEGKMPSRQPTGRRRYKF